MDKDKDKDKDNVMPDLYDIRRFLELRKLLDQPKDNDGTEETMGELITHLIEQHGGV
tara:strand:+ start:316 stop:486 length:171 start_codon:yes stop_codon:yes gene_type:complete